LESPNKGSVPHPRSPGCVPNRISNFPTVRGVSNGVCPQSWVRDADRSPNARPPQPRGRSNWGQVRSPGSSCEKSVYDPQQRESNTSTNPTLQQGLSLTEVASADRSPNPQILTPLNRGVCPHPRSPGLSPTEVAGAGRVAKSPTMGPDPQPDSLMVHTILPTGTPWGCSTGSVPNRGFVNQIGRKSSPPRNHGVCPHPRSPGSVPNRGGWRSSVAKSPTMGSVPNRNL
jgi:hypothetical protein